MAGELNNGVVISLLTLDTLAVFDLPLCHPSLNGSAEQPASPFS
jgi:hypothetical protein